MIELLTLCILIIISRIAYGTIFSLALFVGAVVSVYLTDLNITMIVAVSVVVIFSILKYKKIRVELLGILEKIPYSKRGK